MNNNYLKPISRLTLDGEDFYEYTERYLISKSGKVYDYENARFVSVTPSHLKGERHSYMVACMVLEDGKKTRVRIHRMLAMLFIPNPEDKKLVDHIDHNTFNNNLENLRWVTPSENLQNMKQAKNKYRGVNKTKYGRYRASIFCNGKYKHIGVYDTPELAAIAYNKKADELGFLTRNYVDEYNY